MRLALFIKFLDFPVKIFFDAFLELLVRLVSGGELCEFWNTTLFSKSTDPDSNLAGI